MAKNLFRSKKGRLLNSEFFRLNESGAPIFKKGNPQLRKDPFNLDLWGSSYKYRKRMKRLRRKS